MSQLDWIVLIVTLLAIISYGLYKSRTSRNLEGYFLSNRSMPWGLVLLSIMGTQASAITFLSAPGQAYTDGMRFVQYYFGLPLAMIVICIFFVPIFSKLKVFTAYEYLENRFDGKTRTLTSFLFLLQRGLSTGISVFAPSIILSSLFGWNIYYTNILMGGLLIIYTMSGGAKAVAYTQQLQLLIIFTGMFLAGYMVVNMLPANVSFADALQVSGKLGKLNVITTGFENGKFNWSDQYNLLSGLIGGFFLALSYFGTDQSQVGRYLTAKSLRESRLGLLMNGLVKVPMQFAILLIGALVFTFYQFNTAPIFFNEVQVKKLEQSAYKDSFVLVQQQYEAITEKKHQMVIAYSTATDNDDKLAEESSLASLRSLQKSADSLRGKVKAWLNSKQVGGDGNDTNYIFLRFVVDHLPVGLVGLLIAIIFLASWGSIAAAINSLSSSTMVDFHRRFTKKEDTGETEYRLSKWYTLAWGVFCIIVAMFTYNIGNSLIEAVNVLGSLFYGVILGVFLVAFFIKRITNGSVVFWAALLAELLVLTVFILTKTGVFKMGFLWLNPIGAFGVIFFALLLERIYKQKESPAV
ncbi:MAG TPA: sodium:solute symporter [Chitinophagaceae bacterium]|nr:sodium:solute symporter [Chitinophagaceae bacterium]HQV86757.1 sodium:solute symporter [Chitinophagaceae bacterium]HQX73015.1 sodium:solute symporter [Chitinophagaceae bacterium]HQZ75340.1 sodium:solute symporter [Chitinophagaceae bacterium]